MKLTPKAPKQLELKDHAAYAAAKDKLRKLTTLLAEKIRTRNEDEKYKRHRLDSDARRYLAGRPAALPGMTDSDFDEIAAKVAAAGEVSQLQLMARLRHQAPQASFPDSYDQELISEIQETRAYVNLLERAVVLQKREVSRQKSLAMAEVFNGVRSERSRIAHAITAGLLQLIEALRDERELVYGLRAQDEELPDRLSPRPFPFQVLGDPRLLEWIELATSDQPIDVKMLLMSTSPAEIQQRASQ